jgi:hypothetical protein
MIVKRKSLSHCIGYRSRHFGLTNIGYFGANESEVALVIVRALQIIGKFFCTRFPLDKQELVIKQPDSHCRPLSE